MGLKGLMTAMGMNGFALAGLLISFAAFAAILVWILMRPQGEMDNQARLCIDEDDASATQSSSGLKDTGNG